MTVMVLVFPVLRDASPHELQIHERNFKASLPSGDPLRHHLQLDGHRSNREPHVGIFAGLPSGQQVRPDQLDRLPYTNTYHVVCPHHAASSAPYIATCPATGPTGDPSLDRTTGSDDRLVGLRWRSPVLATVLRRDASCRAPTGNWSLRASGKLSCVSTFVALPSR